jgi:D-2-hydroxyacid dehydrogenase (NADP+)
MVIYTDLYNRTKNYSIPKNILSKIENKFSVKITTTVNPNVEIYWGDKITLHHLEVMPKLKWVHLSKTGINNTTNFPGNIIITNTPDSSDGVAEYAVAGVLYLLRGLDRMTTNRLGFDKNIDHIKPFNQVSCLIVGVGRIGKEVNRLLSALGMNVKGLDRHTHINDLSNLPYDFIINALPITLETLNYFTAETFGKMNKSSYIINVGRGETINEVDLYNALKSKKIRGAFLDVVQNEPIQSENRLLKLNNVFISPHIANALNNSIDTQVRVFEDKLIRIYK